MSIIHPHLNLLFEDEKCISNIFDNFGVMGGIMEEQFHQVVFHCLSLQCSGFVLTYSPTLSDHFMCS